MDGGLIAKQVKVFARDKVLKILGERERSVSWTLGGRKEGFELGGVSET